MKIFLKKNIDVLNLEWSSFPSRDREIATLVCNYLRFQKYKVKEYSVHDGFWALIKYRPKVLWLSNIIGASINVDVAQYAKHLGIPVICSLSEGNIHDVLLNDKKFLLGNNKTGSIIEDKLLVWNQKTKNAYLSHIPEYKDKIKICGGIGFDRYGIYNQQNTWIDKTKWLFVVGIGCWDFGIFSPNDSRFDIIKQLYEEQDIQRFLNDRNNFNDIIYTITKQNPDIFFIIKQHPGVQLDKWASAIDKVDTNLKNVLILKNEKSIFECLSISDIWFSYESTTALEMWLLGKPTGLINPSGTNFKNRHNIYKGQPNFATVDEVQKALDYYQKFKTLPNFEQLQDIRNNLIKEIITFSDNLNHVRAGNEVIALLQHNHLNSKLINILIQTPIKFILKNILYKHIRFIMLTFIIKILTLFNSNITNNKLLNKYQKLIWNNKSFKQYQKHCYKMQINFYKQNNLFKESLLQIKGL